MLLKELVKALREKKGWKQVDLAERLTVSQNYVSKIELGTALPRSRSFREKLAKALDAPEHLLHEAYALSKLDAEEWRAFQQSLNRGIVRQQRDSLLSAQERALLLQFGRLNKRERTEVLAFLNFKCTSA
ncbi:MAG: helix-turn-helix domain-containing protein [Candidatus Wallbacteria bacterium]|nr:helix-turn-helix domain-containing protein [Candidatus Wallbacteria bacterium]